MSSSIDWRDPVESPPPREERIIVRWMPDGTVFSTARYRFGQLGDPQQDIKTWRADCCGRFSGIYLWAHIDECER